MSPVRLIVLLCPLISAFMAAAGVAASEPTHPYGLDYYARFRPDEGYVEARIVVTQSTRRLAKLDLNAPEPRYSHFQGDGDVIRDGHRLIWQVPAEGGELRYRMVVNHERSGARDAEMTDRWAIVRLDEMFPPLRARSRVSAYAQSRLHLDGPDGWRFETRYGTVRDKGVAVDTPGRRTDRPLGWLAAGELGVRRTRIAGRHIAVAGPKGQGFRRMDLIAFLRWTLPELVRIAPTFPDRLLIVGGGTDMWRGGLSGPGSLYLHPSRPLLSGNATSTVLHELMHVATEAPPASGADWIAEGLSEYYSLVILARTGGISGRRFQRSLDWLENWVSEEHGRISDPSTGANTARAALLFRDLDLELRAAGASLDDVTAKLLPGPISLGHLSDLASTRLGHPSQVLAPLIAGTDSN